MNKTLLLILCTIGGVLIIAFLYLRLKLSNHDNGFNRVFSTENFVKQEASMDLKYNSYYIAGKSPNHLYLGNYSAPNKILILNVLTLNTQQIQLKINKVSNLRTSEMFVRIDSPFVFLLEGSAPVILQGQLSDPDMKPIPGKLPNFSSHIGYPVSGSSFILKTYDKQRKQFILSKIKINPVSTALGEPILEKQIDGIFCTDGLLNFDQKSKKLLYVYFYRNQLTCFDTGMHVLSKPNTIDTNTKTKIRLAKITSDHEVTMSAPPLMVNRVSCISNQFVLINSVLRATNEAQASFDTNSVIDVYGLSNGKYQFSFYLPDLNGKKISEMSLQGNVLIVLQDHYLIRYKIDDVTAILKTSVISPPRHFTSPSFRR